MAYVIGDSCISCGSCEGQCPVGAISMGEGKFEIDAAKCVRAWCLQPYCRGWKRVCHHGRDSSEASRGGWTIYKGYGYFPLYQ